MCDSRCMRCADPSKCPVKYMDGARHLVAGRAQCAAWRFGWRNRALLAVPPAYSFGVVGVHGLSGGAYRRRAGFRPRLDGLGPEFREPFGRLFAGIFGDDGRASYNAASAAFGVSRGSLSVALESRAVRPAALFLLLTTLAAGSFGTSSLARYVGRWGPIPVVRRMAWSFCERDGRSLLLSAGLLLVASAIWPAGWLYLA